MPVDLGKDTSFMRGILAEELSSVHNTNDMI